jgi:hypothetical protein
MDLLPAISAALGLGIWTAVQPCPMATNVTAISYLGRRVDSPRWVLLAGLLYALGRALAYVVLAVLVVESLQASRVSLFLQAHVRPLVGPVLMVLGMFFLNLIPVGWSGPGVSEKMQRRVDALGLWAALPLGVFCALAFCPVSAVCFFGSLFALLASTDSRILLPSVYGLGTALPVVAFAVLIATSARAVGKSFNVLTQIVWWAQRVAGVVCLAVGSYFAFRYIFAIF